MNNAYSTCPPLMSDGRIFCDFTDPTFREEVFKIEHQISDNDAHRIYLQQHAKELMDARVNFHNEHDRCWKNVCFHNYPMRGTLKMMADERRGYNSMMMKDGVKNNVGLNCPSIPDYRFY